MCRQSRQTVQDITRNLLIFSRLSPKGTVLGKHVYADGLGAPHLYVVPNSRGRISMKAVLGFWRAKSMLSAPAWMDGSCQQQTITYAGKCPSKFNCSLTHLHIHPEPGKVKWSDVAHHDKCTAWRASTSCHALLAGRHLPPPCNATNMFACCKQRGRPNR